MSGAAPFAKVVCIGLDGATFDVIDPLVKGGKLPTLAKLMATGTRSTLRSTVPPLSAPAWVSFMTGTNPGQHGVFNFRTVSGGVLGSELVGSWAYQGNTIFDHASRAGKDVIAFRVPMTYPAWPVNGLMVSGFPTPDPRTNFSSPDHVGQEIPSLFTLSPVRSMVAGVDAQVENFQYYLERSTEWLTQALREREFDLFCYVNNVTDWIAHKFWRYSDPESPGYEPRSVDGEGLVEYFYGLVDASLGAILDAVTEPTLVVILSDHGTGRRAALRFNPDPWLAEVGLLHTAGRRPVRKLASDVLEWGANIAPKKYWLWRHTPKGVRDSAGKIRDHAATIEWERSRAYAVSVDHHISGINVNVSGREPSGIVPPSEFEAVRDEIIAAAEQVLDPGTGSRVVREARRREEIYSGPYLESAPDVVLELDERYEVGRSSASRPLSRAGTRTGRSAATHRPDGILVMSGPGIREGHDLGGANILDVPATLLWALGLEIPQQMEGRVLTDAFEDPVSEYPIRRGGGSVDRRSDEAYTREEEEQMTAHLEDLGYL
jgi:predicted AlkP superfamily phosphohydrolase/phosphomutase